MENSIEFKYEELSNIYEELAITEEELRSQYEELRKNQEALRISEERYRLAVEGANDALWDWDFINNKFFISEKWKKEMGYEEMKRNLSIIGKWTRLISPQDLEMALNALKDYLKGKTPYFFCEYRMKYKNDSYKWVLARGKILRDGNGRPIRMAGSLSDITDRKVYEEKIKQLAYYDRLTGLPNFHLLKEKIDEKIRECRDKIKVAFLLIDLDNFRNINDTLGHKFGDKVLVNISNELKKIIHSNDMICRIGGDEFLIAKSFVKDKEQVIDVAKDILEYFQKPIIVEGHDIYITISIGIDMYPDNGKDSYTLLKNSDSAMYIAKEKGKNRYEFFHKSIYNNILQKTQLELDLRKAVENNEFLLYYQPQMSLKTSKIIGVEALIRWKHPEKGLISPAKFIPLAESTGLIVPIGKWVLETAILQNMFWQKMGYKEITMSVNVSSLQLQQNDFMPTVKDVLNKVNMNPKFLDIEITESTLMKSIDSVIKKLKSLKEMGIRISLDDFGTGYSSLNYLKKLPINTLKIDKVFVDDIKEDSDDEAITGEIIQLAHKMKIDVVAEGVEIGEQVKFLRMQDCDKIQGYVLSRPLPHDEIEKYLNK
ncbi:diguanylate cyclase (GGDEF)-like protein/PAS domain S-box-containing protein [Clostridium tetanomorphum]|uniref:putative bifunctional diguanylate cyclase/phosphodiesterase n=1 Tax=Clostridium tetanomorphum TaxID=1553 RepID=UPI00044C08D0|nr:GGDEF domain-containing phosphodiesterase [Clostridium tetanomorphum]KAJ51787.1 PAS domain S-box/diguanylate cyclase (GGDEF) domain-containing protein [Clostridium tetanomorphum DSM 665]MBP1865022.1 diguanylate cyclase (GGDEF)-like protein/PAS domain S-box-containing protein [Clostridium tetanomorphum]NRS83380.1 diguanylate cyclase (GGDEF)-like protein/PAS domain S-box-containing protein [Clostridium tetanomorphum]